LREGGKQLTLQRERHGNSSNFVPIFFYFFYIDTKLIDIL